MRTSDPRYTRLHTDGPRAIVADHKTSDQWLSYLQSTYLFGEMASEALNAVKGLYGGKTTDQEKWKEDVQSALGMNNYVLNKASYYFQELRLLSAFKIVNKLILTKSS